MPRRAFLSARESRRIARRRKSQRKGSGARCIGRGGRLLRCGCARVLRLRAVGFGVRGCASGSSRSLSFVRTCWVVLVSFCGSCLFAYLGAVLKRVDDRGREADGTVPVEGLSVESHWQLDQSSNSYAAKTYCEPCGLEFPEPMLERM